MNKSTVQLGNDGQRMVLRDQLNAKISTLTRRANECSTKDTAKVIESLIKEARRYVMFLSRPDSVITFTIDDINQIDKIISYTG